MDSLIFHNGRIAPLREVRLSPGQVGLLMGWGVFTTLRVYRGLPFAFERHWKRMARDAERLQLSMEYAEETVRRAVEELARANHRSEGMVRVSFVKNSGGLWSQAEDLPPTDLLIFTRELVGWPAAHRLTLQPMGIFSAGEYAGAKMLSWVPHAAVLERTHGEGFDDALLMNEKGQLAECTSANIFLGREGRVLTPPLSSGCLAGITREVILEVAPLADVELVEQELTPADLSSADEVFVTSTTREVASVGTISPDWKYPAPGKISQALEDAFKKYVTAYLDQASTSSASTEC
jgi:branched-chain amino acid aminotransferase